MSGIRKPLCNLVAVLCATAIVGAWYIAGLYAASAVFLLIIGFGDWE